MLMANGKYLNKKWKNIAEKYNLQIKLSGYEAITSFSFSNELNQYYKTFITQEMLSKKFLASNQVYLTIHHNKNIDKYIKYLDQIFAELVKLKIKNKSKKN